MQPRDEERTGHDTIVAHAPCIGRHWTRATLVTVPAPLTSRRHVDLKRTSSAVCPTR